LKHVLAGLDCEKEELEKTIRLQAEQKRALIQNIEDMKFALKEAEGYALIEREVFERECEMTADARNRLAALTHWHN
jgi:hypothetical protein